MNDPKNRRKGESDVPDRIFDEEMYEERFIVVAVERREIMLGLIVSGLSC